MSDVLWTSEDNINLKVVVMYSTNTMDAFKVCMLQKQAYQSILSWVLKTYLMRFVLPRFPAISYRRSYVERNASDIVHHLDIISYNMDSSEISYSWKFPTW